MSHPIDVFEELKKRPDLIPEAAEEVRRTYDPEDFIEFHAARILHLVGYAGKGRPKQIEGRRRFSFYDFLLRFPICFEKAAAILETKIEFEEYELNNIDSKMVQHVGGPWDQRYYDILAYLVARKLILLSGEQSWNIAITPSGAAVLDNLKTPENERLGERCRVLRDSLGKFSEKRLQGFIDEHFPYTRLA